MQHKWVAAVSLDSTIFIELDNQQEKHKLAPLHR